MHATPAVPHIKRVPPGVWTALTWCAATAYSFMMYIRLPGEWQPTIYPVPVLAGSTLGLVNTVVATVLSLTGSYLLRRRPLVAIGVLLAASVVETTALSVGAIPLLQFLAVDVALCFVAAGWRRTVSVAALVMAIGTLTAFLSARLLNGWGIGTSTELAVALTAVVAWLVGNSTHQARRYAENLGAQIATQAATAERLRIARELHDMVAHTIGIVALQAGAARMVIETQPARARTALGEVEAASRETLAGLRRMLGALRQAGDGPESTPHLPAEGLADVDRLVAATTAAGVRVDLHWQGEHSPLPPEIDLAAYRIVQESITNVVKHSGGRSCKVSIVRTDDEISIEITDNGRTAGETSHPAAPTTTVPALTAHCAPGGYGLLGMRERVSLLHGEFVAAARPEGGFRVAARLPVAGTA
ncbi:sensor histidine kinase [Kitasatospora sp. McL0602]|uniref:sensor histidine kinase n=1 Tax=Kitasatospora sp. McL0602 TaxID=3439530 RepID=UPI003F8A000C